MEIRLPKPDIKCPQCGSNNFDLILFGDREILCYFCLNCEYGEGINIILEEDPLFCNCEVCKKING